MLDEFIQARKISTPLIAINTMDSFATVRDVTKVDWSALGFQEMGVICWDIVSGFYPANDPGKKVLAKLSLDSPPNTYNDAPTALAELVKMTPSCQNGGALCFVFNAQRLLDADRIGAVSQAVLNLRDPLKKNDGGIVLLSPDFRLPIELSQDVVVLSEVLPGREQQAALIATVCKNANADCPKARDMDRAVDAVLGLTNFAAEQVVSMSLRRNAQTKKIGIDYNTLWTRKREKVNETKGLSMSEPIETFATIGGNASVKDHVNDLISKSRPGCILLFDEIEKMLAGGSSDSSGVTQDIISHFLSWSQDKKVDGMLFFGVPGACKTAMAKAMANEAKAQFIKFDIGSCKESLVGSSGSNFRQAIRIAESAGGGRVFMIGTCNSVDALSPELMRRFKLGNFYFDLPEAEERAAIWKIYVARYELYGQELPDDFGWTGAQIETACELAYRTGKPVAEVGRKRIIPYAKANRSRLDALRNAANGTFLSSSYDGAYDLDRRVEQDKGRSIRI